MGNRSGRGIFILLPVVFITLLFYLPLLLTLSEGINSNFFIEIFKSNYYKRIISFTFYQAILSSLLSIIIAIPGSYLVTRYNFPGKKLFISLTSLPFVLPSILTVLGFVLLFGNNGVLNRLLIDIFNFDKPPIKILYSIKAVLLAHIFYNFPLAIRIISSLWKKIPYELNEASYSLGSGKLKTFFKVTLPYLSSGLVTSFTLIFLYCFMSFGIILVLGGGPALSTIEVEVYRFARISLNLPKAATLSLIESFVTVTVLFFYMKYDNKKLNLPQGRKLVKKLKPYSGALFTLYLIPLFLILLAPLLTIVVNSFIHKTGFTGSGHLSLHWYKSIFGALENRFTLTALNAIKNSLLLGFCTVMLSLPLSLLITFNMSLKFKFKTIYKILFFLPMGVSSIIIGLSYLTVSKSSGSYIAIILAHTVISLPISIRSINTVYKTVDQSLIEASQSLGLNRFKTFLKIELPLIKSGMVTAGIFSFALSIGEMNASIMLAPSGFITIPLAIYQLIGKYNFYGACALGTLLLLTCLLSFRLIDKMDN